MDHIIDQEDLPFGEDLGSSSNHSFSTGSNVHPRRKGSKRPSAKDVRIQRLEKQNNDLQVELTLLEKQNNDLQDKLNHVYSFNPNQASKVVGNLKKVIGSYKNKISNNPYLQSLLPLITEAEFILKGLAEVLEAFHGINLNILKPIDDEFKKGINTTVFWSIISIAFTNLLSLGLTLLVNTSFYRLLSL
jgi:hypothetical protein